MKIQPIIIICLIVALSVVSLKYYNELNKFSPVKILQKPEHILRNTDFLANDIYLTGNQSYKIQKDAPNKYGPEWKYLISDLNFNNYKKITFRYAVNKINSTKNLLFVMAIWDPNKETDNDMLFEEFSTSQNQTGTSENGEWTYYENIVLLDGEYALNNVAAFYFWNTENDFFYIDDFSYTLE